MPYQISRAELADWWSEQGGGRLFSDRQEALAQEIMAQRSQTQTDGKVKAVLLVKLFEKHNAAMHRDDFEAAEEVSDQIDEWSIGVSVRSGWHRPYSPGAHPDEEYRFTFFREDPRVEIRGRIGSNGVPETATMYLSDFDGIRRVRLDREQHEAVEEFAMLFYYFGE